MENFALIVVAVFIGYFIKRLKVFSDDAPIILNQFVIYISIPAMVLLKIPKLTISLESAIPAVIAWVVMIFSALFIFFISKFYAFSKEVTGSLLLVSVLGNTTFLGIPLISAYLGDSSLPYILIYDQFGSFIFLTIYGTFIASYYSNTTEVDLKILAKKVILFPPTISLIVAFILHGMEFHPALTSVLKSLANTIVPIALVAVGLQLRFKLTSNEIKPLSIALSTKLILSPMIAYAMCIIFSWDSQVALVSIMEAGMGPMVTAGAIASMSGLAPRLSSAIVGYGVLISFLTTWGLFKFIS